MKEQLIKSFTNPEATVVGANLGITLHLKAAEFKYEQWILKPKTGKVIKIKNSQGYESEVFVPYEKLTAEDRGFQDDEVFERLVRACVKGVERGVGIKLTADSDPIDLADLMEWENDLLTNKSFKILMRTLNQDPSLIGELYKFYTESSDVSKFVVINEKKK